MVRPGFKAKEGDTPWGTPATNWATNWSVVAVAEEGSEVDAVPDQLFHWEGLSQPEEPGEPYTLQWFLAIEHQRHSRSARWIPRLLEFTRHPGETLLGIGNGLGTDWLQYARHEAQVIACSPVAAELGLIRRNFELRGLQGRFLHADPADLPVAPASIDVICITGLLHETPEPERVVRECYRVLRPGGKVLAVVPAKYHIDFWRRTLCPWQDVVCTLLRRSPLRPAPAAEQPTIEFSARRLRRLFVGFESHRVHKRQLSRREIPVLLRWLPRSLLERLMGRFLILKAFKPISAAALPHDEPLAA